MQLSEYAEAVKHLSLFRDKPEFQNLPGLTDRALFRLGQAYGGAGAPDVDLLIRAGGEQRLSDFLLWESAYAELRFVARMWPDFAPADLAAALDDFHARDRRFGALPLAVSTPSTRSR